MRGRAMSEDDADQLTRHQLPVFEKAAPQPGAAFSLFGPPKSSIPTAEEFEMLSTTHPYDALMEITARPNTVFVQGKGSWLWDDSGKRYLDFIQGWAVNSLGHSPAIVTEALTEQSKVLLTPSPAFFNEPSLKLAKALVDHSCVDQVFFTNSGGEAN